MTSVGIYPEVLLPSTLKWDANSIHITVRMSQDWGFYYICSFPRITLSENVCSLCGGCVLCRNVLLTIKEAFRAGVNGDCPAHMGRPELHSSDSIWLLVCCGHLQWKRPRGELRKPMVLSFRLRNTWGSFYTGVPGPPPQFRGEKRTFH